MPGQTPNRNYPYPVDSDAIDVAGDIRRLATAIDTDTGSFVTSDTTLSNRITAETNARIAQDNAIMADYVARDAAIAPSGHINGVHRSDHLSIVSAYGEAVTDGFGTIFHPFPTSFTVCMVVACNASSADMHIAPFGVGRTDGVLMVARFLSSGAGAIGYAVGYSFIAVGFWT